MDDLVVEIKTEKTQKNSTNFFEERTEQPEEKEGKEEGGKEEEKMGDHSKVVLRVSDPGSRIISSGRRRSRK